MNDQNKWNLKRLLSVFAALAIVFLSVVAATFRLKFWWASLPTTGAAIASAVILFKRGFIDPDKRD